MSTAMISQMLQGAVLSITSNVLAQAISSYQDSTPFALNFTQVFTFAVFSIISSPPNIIWQTFLEDQFPTSIPVSLPPSSPSEKQKSSAADPSTRAMHHAPASPGASKNRTSKRNILIKFLLDQTFGAVVNTIMFLGYMAFVNAQGNAGVDAWNLITRECKNKTWPMMKDGYKFWPAISLISFVWVPVDRRVVFGSLVGVLWGIYLSLAVVA